MQRDRLPFKRHLIVKRVQLDSPNHQSTHLHTSAHRQLYGRGEVRLLAQFQSYHLFVWCFALQFSRIAIGIFAIAVSYCQKIVINFLDLYLSE
jgi:hypothetical protein